MDIYSEAKVSPAGTVNKKDLKQVFHNMVVFLIPLVLVYLLQINGVLQDRALALEDLMPTAATYGAIQLYVVNALMDLLRKFQNNKA